MIGEPDKNPKTVIQRKLLAHSPCPSVSMFRRFEVFCTPRVMSILIYKNEQQEGPFDLPAIELAIRHGQISVDDFAWQEGCTDWVPLRTLLPAEPTPTLHLPATDTMKHRGAPAGCLTGDEQDAGIVGRIVAKVGEHLMRGEVIEYVGVQKKPLLSIAPDAVVLTKSRLLIVRTKSMEVEAFEWESVSNVELSERLLTSTIACTITGGRKIVIDSMPKKQARKIQAFAQELEEKRSWWEQRGF